MQTNNFIIKRYKAKYKQQIRKVWEQSVLATHNFLKQEDFNEIKAELEALDFNLLQVYYLMQNDTIFGFIGVADRKIEMLFLSPEYFGQGFGKILIDFAIQKLSANKVDVNEQNHNALKFYQKSGIETFERSQTDDQGRNYPLLRMRLKKSENQV